MACQPSRGLSGGLVIFWYLDRVKYVALAQSQYWIWVTLKLPHVDFRFHIINIYSPLTLDKKRILWREMASILGRIKDEPICFVGDFNCIRSDIERANCVYKRKDVEEFNEMIEDHNLLEISMTNGKYTWFGHDGKRSKLDRILVDVLWFKLTSWKVKALNRKHSDHKPLLLYSSVEKVVAKPFRVFNCYLNDTLAESIKTMIQQGDGWEDISLTQAVKKIKAIIKCNAKGGKGELDIEIKLLEQRLTELDEDEYDIRSVQEVRDRLQKLYVMRDSMLRQKARMDWVALGDGNTKFFHQAIQKRRGVNNIIKLFWNGVWITEAGQIKEAFLQHYSQFFKSNHIKILTLGNLLLPRLADADKDHMVRKFSVLEIEAALHSLAEDKAPDPDGLNIRSLKFLWPFIGRKIISFIDIFW